MVSFNNNASQDRFIGKLSLEEVQRKDTLELEEIGGSFESIARREERLIEAIKLSKPKISSRFNLAFESPTEGFPLGFDLEDYMIQYFTKLDSLNFFPDREFDSLKFRSNFPFEQVHSKLKQVDSRVLVPGEKNIELFFESPAFMGGQKCPFEGCSGGYGGSSSFYTLRHIPSGRLLSINGMTVHLVREHKLLQKENQYGIGAKEFYKTFMSDM